MPYKDRQRRIQITRDWKAVHQGTQKEYMANYWKKHPWDASNNRGRIDLLRQSGIHLQIVENKDANGKKTGTWTVYPRLVASNLECFHCGRIRKSGIVTTKKIRTPSIHLRFPFHKGFKGGFWQEKKPIEFPDGTCLHDTFDDFKRAVELAYFGRTCRCSGTS